MGFIRNRGVLLPLIFLFLISFCYSLEECSGETITSDEVPCLILIPYDGVCSDETVEVFNSSDLLYQIPLSNFTGDQCFFSFNQSTENKTYSFSYSTGDTGNILIEVNEMINIFHVLVYAGLSTLGIVFLMMMHIFQEDDTSIVYGFISSAIWLITAVVNISGFNFINGVSFIVDVNYYITALFVILCLYSGIASYFFYKNNYQPKDNPYYLRQ